MRYCPVCFQFNFFLFVWLAKVIEMSVKLKSAEIFTFHFQCTIVDGADLLLALVNIQSHI